MPEAYERLLHLWQTTGSTVTPGDAQDGIAYAFAAALDLVRDRLNRTAALLLFRTETADYAAIASLLGMDAARFTQEELADEVHERMKHSFGDYTAPQLEHAFSLVGSGTFTCSRGNAVFAGVAPEDLAELGKFIAAFLLFDNKVSYDANGMTFDEWEATGRTFYEYDSLTLPFDILDNYRRTV